MGYNGNHRRPYNVWKPSTHKRGLNLLFPRARKPKYNLFGQNKAAQAIFRAQAYKLPPSGNNAPTGKGKVQKGDDTLSCLVCLLIAVALLALIGWIFGWIWSIAIPLMLILFTLIPK